jgi:hypothetical protein
VLDPIALLKEHHLVDLAGHRNLRHAPAFEAADRGADARDADFRIIVAEGGERWIGVAFDSEAEYGPASFAQRLGHDQRKMSPAGKQADGRRRLPVVG